MTAPVTRLVYAVAAHLHMTAGAVLDQMGAHELMTWGYLFDEHAKAQQQAASAPLELSVEDEINAWR
ncbi:hypothetical protein AWB80_02889 [Caballeronia pedi]|uniref:Uncharacterized protein n=1 Tax=Caballeronia pedi TaxID=1777141 RepID=A0A158B2T2_9BURK|nr:hypothetical protein [Caballeronia pedi]SAK63607.1 hypothetical protein AWB80_02889 [Caballeronia pedi]